MPTKPQTPSLKKPAAQTAPKRPKATASQVSPHHDSMVATELSRNALARERFEFLMRLILILFGALTLSICGNVYFGMQKTEYKYFASDPEGGIREVFPLEKPIQGTGEVLEWASTSLVQAFTMSFANYQQQLEVNRHLFTEAGWAGFEEAIARQRMVEEILKNKLVSSAVPGGAPVIVSQGIVENGRYGWKIQMPLTITYDSASSNRTTTLNVEAVIVRRPESEDPKGLGIGQIIAR